MELNYLIFVFCQMLIVFSYFSDELEIAVVYFRDGETAENYRSEKVCLFNIEVIINLNFF